MNTSNLVRASVVAAEPGVLLNAADVARTTGIDRRRASRVLAAMAREGHLVGVIRGLYAKPRFNEVLGRFVPPAPEDVVAAVARSTGETIQVHGAVAARRFGLTTQVPVHSVYLTTGRTRSLPLTTGEITLLHTSPRHMEMAGRPSGDALAALLYLGEGEVTVEVIARVRSKIPPDEYADLKASTALPSWLSGLMPLPVTTQR